MKISIKVSGAIFDRGIVMKSVIKPALVKATEHGFQSIKRDTPVLTGKLKAGWFKAVEPYTIDNPVEYADAVEERGTPRGRAKGAVRAKVPAIAQFLADEITRNLKVLQ